MTDHHIDSNAGKQPKLPPRAFVRGFWAAHRALLRVSGGRVGLWRAGPEKWGSLRLVTVGRRSGSRRAVVVGYLDHAAAASGHSDGYLLLAMNGWAEPEPAWWLNLQAHPVAEVRGPDGTREMTARELEGADRDAAWQRWSGAIKDLDGLARHRSRRTAVVLLEPRDPVD